MAGAGAVHRAYSLLSSTILFLMIFFFHGAAHAQQFYYNTSTNTDCYNSNYTENYGYRCGDASSGSATSCNTYAYMMVKTPAYTVNYIATSLNFSTASAIASASSLASSSAALSVGEGVYIPFRCSCSGNISSYNITYTIVPADTFWKLSNGTYEGLTTCKAVINANPDAEITNLQIGQKVTIPIRCACPSKAQIDKGYKYLVSYPITDGDNISSVVERFSLNLGEFLFTNGINSSSELFPATSLLLPFLSTPTNPPNATISAASTTPSSSSSSAGGSKTGMIIGIAVAAAVVVILVIIGVMALIVFKSKKKKPIYNPIVDTPAFPSIGSPVKPVAFSSIGSPVKPVGKPHISAGNDIREAMYDFSADKLVTYRLDDIKHATNDFSPANRIRGAVYRGVVKGKVVAVKQVTRNVSHELEILQKVHHVNLIALLGSCTSSQDQSYLVYEYAENGSLSDWLHGENYKDVSTGSQSSSTLSWITRLQIASDVAIALEYIHEHTTPSYVHKDIKSSNILLDSKLRGKVANFGLAKSTTATEEVTRHIEGTQGYIAPEYLSLGLVSPKIDVFALGVVLLELLSGEEPITRDRFGKERFLSELIGPLLCDDGDHKGKERLEKWIDRRLRGTYPLDCAYSVAILARSCVADDPNARPSAREVAYTLARLLDVALEWEPSSAMENYNDSTLEAR